ncbi:type VI secretion system tip protein VgrG [Desulfonema ishimotonii]|uniref:Type VI secretion system tip protein VgrG n=1 Tax=Desulfonema ishimotonii TaxID=45657 RepID=A0A401FYW1_9BACT|nr:type VI secretion system tip protein VgrG [Desulfonema ishimotonii]GBC62137.1 type VI secretion system tip protein VgrG [Desulfonema ishimotonii]
MARPDHEKSVFLYVTTPLDGPFRKFFLDEILGEEQISGLFHYRLKLITDDDTSVDFAAIMGKPVTVTIAYYSGEKRYISGIVTHFIQAGTHGSVITWYAEIRPWLWQLTLTTDCRIFQNQTVPEIIATVFSDLGFTDFRDSTTGAYDQRIYCVQYNETSFNFVSRLMEEEGIFYFFDHADGMHTLVLGDDADVHPPCPGNSTARFRQVVPEHADDDYVGNCSLEQQMISNKYEARDYNFEIPDSKLISKVDARESGPLRIYTWPGGYARTDAGDRIADRRIEACEQPHTQLRGEGFCRFFMAGYRFDLTEHEQAAVNGTYVLRHLSLRATPESYSNAFTAFPADVQFRPPQIARKPKIYGAQTAVVVGKSGEEIWTDTYGRVRVQFHWDELGKNDENSSCWVRVTQTWAGKNWGTLFIPRIGAEVIVSFLDGDPDRPIITGTVYNAAQTVPYPLPGEKTKSTMKTNSSPGGGGSNEIRFEDKKGSEEIFIHGQKDWTIVIENDKNQTVGHDESLSVGNNRTKSVGVDQSESIGSNKSITVGANHTESVGSSKSLQVGVNHTESVGGNMSVTVGSNRIETVGVNSAETVGAVKALTVGAAYQVSVGAAMNETVAAVKAEEVGASKSVNVGANMSENVGGGMSVSVGKDLSETVGKTHSLKAKKVMIDADDEITLKTGKAMIQMKKSGDITIRGKKIQIKGSGNIIIKGKKVLEN